MNIAIFTNNYLPNPYGVSMSIESFRKEMEKLGHKVYIFAPKFAGFIDANQNVFRYPAIDVVLRGVRFPLAMPFSKRIDKVLDNLKIDVIHAQHPNLLGWQAKRWAKKKCVPLIFTWHTLYDQYAHFAPLVPAKTAAWWAIGNAKRFANIADHIIVPTPAVKEILKKWGVKNENMDAIASGVDENIFANSQRSEIREKYAVAENEILLLLVSRLTAEKNINFLFEAILPMLKKHKAVKFLVVGGGQEREKLEQMIVDMNLSNQVFFAGVVPAEQIKNYYAAADIFVHASKSETQGMILTEAMYAGLPIVAVEASGAKDLVRNNESGFLVGESKEKFANAVLKLVENEKLRIDFANNAQKIARENYTAQICTKNMLQVYEKAINKKHV